HNFYLHFCNFQLSFSAGEVFLTLYFYALYFFRTDRFFALWVAGVLWAGSFLPGFEAGLGTGRIRTNWIGLPLARVRSSTSISGKEARNLFRLLEPKLRTSKSG